MEFLMSIMAAIAAALSFASSMLTATTSAPFAAAITTDDRLMIGRADFL
jgi:hypothetical protein